MVKKKETNLAIQYTNKPQCTSLSVIWFVSYKHNQNRDKAPLQRVTKMGFMEEQPSNRNKQQSSISKVLKI